MASEFQFETIQDLIDYTYGGAVSEMAGVAKADAPVLSSTTGVFNAVFGAIAFSQLNNEANALALLPKYPWQHSGYRVITADAGSAADGGVAEGATLPETVKPTWAEITVPVAEIAHTFNVSQRQELFNKAGDDTTASMQDLRGYFGMLHPKRMNQQILVTATTARGNNLESIDRVTGSSVLEGTGSYSAGDFDIYGIDRSANTWANAQVSHNSGTDRVLTDEIIRDLLADIETAGGRTNIILTGSDTKSRIEGIYGDQVRYQGVFKNDVLMKVGLNGVETEEGVGFGVRVATVYNIPLFKSQAVPKDTISRIYMLDTTEQADTGIPRLGLSVLQPTSYYESGMSASDRNPFGIDFIGTEGMYYTAAQVVCTFFAGQGSIRDLL